MEIKMTGKICLSFPINCVVHELVQLYNDEHSNLIYRHPHSTSM